MAYGENTAAVLYRVENTTKETCSLSTVPFFKFAPKEETLKAPFSLTYNSGEITGNGYTLLIRANGETKEIAPVWQTLSYPEDAKDGRPDSGMAGACCCVDWYIPPEETIEAELVFSMEEKTANAGEIRENLLTRLQKVEENSGFQNPIARQLAVAADAYIARRDSTDGMTI